MIWLLDKGSATRKQLAATLDHARNQNSTQLAQGTHALTAEM
jgi:hypothetical protein